MLLADRFPDLELRIPCVTAGWLPRREEVKTGLRLSLSTTLELLKMKRMLLQCPEIGQFLLLCEENAKKVQNLTTKKLLLGLGRCSTHDFFSSRLLCDDVSPFKEESEGWKFSLLRDQSVVDMTPD